MRKFIIIFTLLLITVVFANAKNPYSQFGCKAGVLQTEQERSGEFGYEILAENPDELIQKIKFDFSNMKYTTYDFNNEIIKSGEILLEMPKRWLSQDPLKDKYPGMSPYNAMGNNPILFIDPDGRATITSQDGTVQSVTKNDDLSIYSRDNDNLVGPVATGYGLTKRGETEDWDEFRNPDTQEVFGTIKFGKSWESVITSKNKDAKNYTLGLISAALESFGGGDMDIKTQYSKEGRLLNGKYASSRSAGNFLAGFNGATCKSPVPIGIDSDLNSNWFLSGTLPNFNIYPKYSIDKTTMMKMAGTLHNSTTDLKESYPTALKKVTDTFLNGTTYGASPYYGEIPYAGRMILRGWNHGINQR